MSFIRRGVLRAMLGVLILACLLTASDGRKSTRKIFKPSSKVSSPFLTNFAITWGNDNVQMSSDGSTVNLQLNHENASSFASKNEYQFGYISTDIKLVPGNSAGTVVAYYLSSSSSNHDELDFEFLGNTSGEPYIVQTNVFANGVGEREQRFYMWFDPSADYHKYSFLWNEEHIVFYVDSVPIRQFKNLQNLGLKFPTSQPMRLYSSLWNGDTWATQGGAVKIDWNSAPFVASFKGFNMDACMASQGSNCQGSSDWWSGTQYQTLSASDEKALKSVQQNYMIYDYCTDAVRNPTPPLECSYNS